MRYSFGSKQGWEDDEPTDVNIEIPVPVEPPLARTTTSPLGAILARAATQPSIPPMMVPEAPAVARAATLPIGSGAGRLVLEGRIILENP